MSAAQPDPGESNVPLPWRAATLIESLPCRHCGYDLRELRADARCPECGFEVWATIELAVDPGASRLPALRNPRGVGNALLCLTICMLSTALLMLTPRIGISVDGWATALQRASALTRDPALLWVPSAALAMAVFAAVWDLHRTKDLRSNELWRITVGFVIVLLVGWFWAWVEATPGPGGAGWPMGAGEVPGKTARDMVMLVAAAIPASIALIGLRGVLGVVGERSRTYRSAGRSRQSIELIIAALGAGVLAAAIRALSEASWKPVASRDILRALGTMVLWISLFMVLIGLAYLVLNAWWIRQALRRPPPPLDRLLLPPLPPDTSIPD